MDNQVEIQREYYRRMASRYDRMHTHAVGEHDFALAFMQSMIEFLQEVESVLDVGSGTGRALRSLKATRPDLRLVGIEPSPELREVGQAQALSPQELVDGDAQNMRYADAAFDLVCEFGALHHIPYPDRAVAEMLRVAAKAIFIADCNNFGRGSLFMRLTKQTLRSVGLWPVADFIKTRGKGYLISEGDGLANSNSVCSNYSRIKKSLPARTHPEHHSGRHQPVPQSRACGAFGHQVTLVRRSDNGVPAQAPGSFPLSLTMRHDMGGRTPASLFVPDVRRRNSGDALCSV